MGLQIQEYESSAGKGDAFDFILAQSGEAKAGIFKHIEFLSKYGLIHMIQNGSVKHIKSGKSSFYELRVKTDSCFFRFPFVVKSEVVYLLFGFKKQTNKMEKKDLNLAIRRAKEVLG